MFLANYIEITFNIGRFTGNIYCYLHGPCYDFDIAILTYALYETFDVKYCSF